MNAREIGRSAVGSAVSVLIAAVAFVSFLSTADAALPGENGKLLGTSANSSATRIFELGLDGNYSFLSPPSGTFYSPAISPDGRLFAESRSPGEGLWLGSKGGVAGFLEISDPASGGTDPEFSPDGKSVFYSRPSGYVGGGIFAWEIVRYWIGSGKSQVLSGLTTVETSPGPAASPNGRLLVYSSQSDGSPRTQILRLSDRESWQFPVDMPTKFATFSPDGEQLAFLGFTDGGWHLCESRLDGSDLEVLAEVADKAISGPAYSPDGSKIAFTAGYPGEEEILIRDLTTGLSSNLSAPGVAWQIVDWTRKRLFGIRSYNRKGHFIRVSVFNPGLISVRGRAIKKRILKVDHSGIFRINLIWAARRTATEIRVRFKPVGALAEEQSKRITRRVPEDLRSSAS